MFAMALALFAAEPPPPMAVEVVRDAITDRVRAFATARDDGNRLVISCDPARHEGARITFHARHWLARGNVVSGTRPIIYRFDDMPARRMLWDVNDRRGTLTSRRRVDFFLREMMVAQRLVIRARDIENRRFDMVFRLRDAGPAVEQALAACAAG